MTIHETWPPLVLAAYHGQLAVVRGLLESKVDPGQRSPGGWSALMHAINQGHLEIATLLIKAGCDLNVREPEDGWSALALAAYHGNLEITKLLLERGADIRLRTAQGWTALTLAIHHSHEKVALALQKAGAVA